MPQGMYGPRACGSAVVTSGQFGQQNVRVVADAAIAQRALKKCVEITALSCLLRPTLPHQTGPRRTTESPEQVAGARHYRVDIPIARGNRERRNAVVVEAVR